MCSQQVSCLHSFTLEHSNVCDIEKRNTSLCSVDPADARIDLQNENAVSRVAVINSLGGFSLSEPFCRSNTQTDFYCLSKLIVLLSSLLPGMNCWKCVCFLRLFTLCSSTVPPAVTLSVFILSCGSAHCVSSSYKRTQLSLETECCVNKQICSRWSLLQIKSLIDSDRSIKQKIIIHSTCLSLYVFSNQLRSIFRDPAPAGCADTLGNVHRSVLQANGIPAGTERENSRATAGTETMRRHSGGFSWAHKFGGNVIFILGWLWLNLNCLGTCAEFPVLKHNPNLVFILLRWCCCYSWTHPKLAFTGTRLLIMTSCFVFWNTH